MRIDGNSNYIRAMSANIRSPEKIAELAMNTPAISKEEVVTGMLITMNIRDEEVWIMRQIGS